MTRSATQNHAPLGLPRYRDILFAFPHPDDESMTGGLMMACKAGKITPHVFYATDGENSTYGDEAMLRAYGRRSEAAKALGIYGVRHIYHGGLPDGGLLGEHNVALQQKIAAILKKRQFAAVITLGSEGFDHHPDHIAVHNAALHASLEAVENGQDIRLLGLTTGAADYHVVADPVTKLRSLARHPSQFTISTDPRRQPGGDMVAIEDAPGILLSTDTLERLAPYWLNHRQEAYEDFDLIAQAHRAAETALVVAGRL